MDGPDIHGLFTRMQSLNAESNLKEICQYLRFSKSEGTYQTFLRHYLPLLAHPAYRIEFAEFIGDLEDKELAKELKASVKQDAEESTEVEAPVDTPAVEAVVATEAPKRKYTKKAL